MSYTAPRTWVTGEVVTAAQLNANVRDNVTDLDRRGTMQAATVATSQSVASGTYTDLATVGPAVSASTGTSALVLLSAGISASTGQTFMGFAVSGATTLAADDTRAMEVTSTSPIYRQSIAIPVIALTAGTNTFTAKYRGTSGTSTWVDRWICVLPLYPA